MYLPDDIFFETFSFASSIWAVIEYEGLLAKSPEPPSLQKIQPPVLILPSLLGHERPELIDNLYTLHPNLFLK